MSSTPSTIEMLQGRPSSAWPDDVRVYCERNGLTRAVLLASNLACECFDVAGFPSFRLEQDVEEKVEYVVVEVFVANPERERRQRYKVYIARWLRGTSFPERRRIRLAYYSATDG